MLSVISSLRQGRIHLIGQPLGTVGPPWKGAVSAGVGLGFLSLFRGSFQLAGSANTHHAFLARPVVSSQVGVI